MLDSFFLAVLAPALLYTGDYTNTNKALLNASQAYLVQSGIQERLQKFEKRTFTNKQRNAAAAIAWTHDIVSKQYVSYIWTF